MFAQYFFQQNVFQSYYSLISNGKVNQLAQSFQGNFNPIIVLFLTH